MARARVPACSLAAALLLPGIPGYPSVSPSPVPGADDFADAPPVEGTRWSLSADLGSATRESWERVEFDLFGQSRWWRWVAPETGVVGWDSSSSPAPVAVAVFESDVFLRLRPVSETFLRPVLDGTGFLAGYRPTPIPRGSFPAARDRTYWIRLDGVRRSDGGYLPFPDPLAPMPVAASFAYLTDAAPANDTFAAASLLSLTSPDFRGRLEVATSEPGEPRPHQASSGRTLWWTWTAEETGSAHVRVDPESPSPLFCVYRRGVHRELIATQTSATEYGNACTRYWGTRKFLSWDTVAGETYYLQADAFPEFDRSLEFLARLAFTPAPTNDSILSPAEPTGTDFSVVASNEGATRSPLEPTDAAFLGTSSVWYRWTLPRTGLIQVTTNEPTRFAEPDVEILPPVGTPIYGSVFTYAAGPCSGALDDLHPLPPFEPIFSVYDRFGTTEHGPWLGYVSHGTNEVWAEPRGTEVWIQMDSPDGTTGLARLNAHLTPPPANDARDRAIVLPPAAVRVTGRSAGATRQTDETLPAPAGSPAGTRVAPRRSVWWEWTAPDTGTWALVPVVGAYDHCFALYRTDESQLADPAAWTPFAPAFFHADEGERLRIGVFGMNGWGGNLEFKLLEAAAPRLSRPTRVDAFGESWWVFDGLADWDLPFVVEASENLRDWTTLLADRTPKSPTVRIRIPFEFPSYFVRFRADIPSR